MRLEHKNDPRHHVYTRDQFESGQTSDALWNAAQFEMINSGRMHSFMRVYWGKKVENANSRYSI